MKNIYIEKKEFVYQNEEFKRKESKSSKREQGFSSKVRTKFTRIEMCYSLMKMREILIQERNRDYYRNPMNILEEVTLENGIYITESGIEYDTVQKMLIYQNGMYDIGVERKSRRRIKN